MSNEKEYSQVVCGDGAEILCDGQPLTIEEILKGLHDGDVYRDLCGELLHALKKIERFNGLKSDFRDKASSAITKAEAIMGENSNG